MDRHRIDEHGKPLGTCPKKKERGLCIVKFCRNQRGKGRSYCHACARLMYTRRHPQKAYYQNLRRHTKERGIGFTLSYERFVAVTQGFDWKQYSVPHGQRMSIDRIDVSRGYDDDNIQPLTVSENCRKQNALDYKGRRLGWYANGEA
jgi:hypothetical protein